MIPRSFRSSSEDAVLVRAVFLPNRERVITYIDHGGTAACLCFDSNRSEVLLVSQERPVVQAQLLEVPSGRIEKGERPEDAAAREVLEESGYRAGTLTPLGSFFSSVGLTNEKIHIFTTGEFVRLDSAVPEFVPQWIRLDECMELITAGELLDSKTALAIHLLNAHRLGSGYGLGR